MEGRRVREGREREGERKRWGISPHGYF